MAWTFLLNSALFFRFKNWCKITSWKKSSLTSARSRVVQWVKLPFLSKKCIFRAEKGIFSKSSFYSKMFSDPKYSFSVCQKKFFWSNPKLIFFTKFNLPIFHFYLCFFARWKFKKHKFLLLFILKTDNYCLLRRHITASVYTWRGIVWERVFDIF